MEKFYINQPIKVKLTVKQDLTGATAQIKCRKPGDSNTESFIISATVIDAATGQIEGLISSTQNDKVGKWAAWAYITFADNSEIAGQPIQFTIHPEGY